MSPAMFGARYLDTLNAEQRRAVEHGVAAAAPTSPAPLLVIAGAGSGKTNTLAHRVAHLIVNGADPGRILLLTFSRRAAAEMEPPGRAHRRRGAGRAGRGARNPIRWAGTFHAIGARLLRDYAARSASIRLHHPRPRGFRRPDEPRAPRARLLEDRRSAFPQKATCLAIYSRAVNAERAARGGAGAGVPLVRGVEGRAARLFAAYVEAKQAPGRARLRRPAALLGAS